MTSKILYMQDNVPYIPDADDFLEMWKHFNGIAHECGIVKTALNGHDHTGSDWLNYYLYFNHFQVKGQTLLVYCLREILDIAATHEFSDFDLTGYALEPEQEYHDEAKGYLRQALDDLDVLQFSSVRNLPELHQTLPAFLESQGSLKVLVLPVLDPEEFKLYRDVLDNKLPGTFTSTDTEYVVLTPRVTNENQVEWLYWTHTVLGTTEPKLLEEIGE